MHLELCKTSMMEFFCQFHACFKAVRGLKEKDSEKGRSSHPDVFCKKGVLENFATYTGRYLCWSLFQIMLQVLSMQIFIKKRDSGTDFFLYV